MTREEAIRIMALEREDWETSHCTPYERKCAFDMAIEALKAQESKQDADDTISMAAAIKAIDVKNVNKGIISALQSIIDDLPSAQQEQQHGKVFKEIVVEYPSYNTYPEYIGKPYFSIKYTENGQGFIGYGTYKPEVLSEYLKEYFMPPVQPETHEKRTKTHACDLIERQAAIDALEKVAELYPWRVPGDRDSYSQYNEAWQDALNRADGEIEALPSAQPDLSGYSDKLWKAAYERGKAEALAEREKGKWINIREGNRADCDQCGQSGRAWMNFCFLCGARMMQEGQEGEDNERA